jgi:hypothetical protein
MKNLTEGNEDTKETKQRDQNKSENLCFLLCKFA